MPRGLLRRNRPLTIFILREGTFGPVRGLIISSGVRPGKEERDEFLGTGFSNNFIVVSEVSARSRKTKILRSGPRDLNKEGTRWEPFVCRIRALLVDNPYFGLKVRIPFLFNTGDVV